MFSVPLQGDRIFCSVGWWFREDYASIVTMDTGNGGVLDTREMGNGPHTSFVSADNKFVYAPGRTGFSKFSPEEEPEVMNVSAPGMGDDGVYPSGPDY